VPEGFAQRVTRGFNEPMHYAIIFGYEAMHVLANAIATFQR